MNHGSNFMCYHFMEPFDNCCNEFLEKQISCSIHNMFIKKWIYDNCQIFWHAQLFVKYKYINMPV